METVKIGLKLSDMITMVISSRYQWNLVDFGLTKDTNTNTILTKEKHLRIWLNDNW